MNHIYFYLDYRQYLLDAYAFFKKKHKYLSYAYLAHKVNVERSSLIKIFNGHRHLPLDRMDLMTQEFSIFGKEKIYFEKLVQYGRALDTKEKEILFQELQNLKPIEQLNLEQKHLKLFVNWYSLAIWSMIGIKKCSVDFDFSKHILPELNPHKAKEALQDLLKCDLIGVDDLGFYYKKNNNLLVPNSLNPEEIQRYFKTMLNLAGDALQHFDVQEKHFSALVIDIPDDSIPEIKRMIADFRKNMIRHVNQMGPSNRVMQLSVQLFPLTQKMEKK